MKLTDAVDAYEQHVTQEAANGQCSALTRDGRQCPNPAGASGYCFTHDPALETERLIAHKLGGVNRARRRVSGDKAPEINTSADLKVLGQLLLNDAWAMDDGLTRVKAIRAAGDFMLRVFEVVALEARVKAIEEKAHGKAIEETDQAVSDTP